MFSYKTAVAFKNLGYKNIKIYNGGIKDWRKSGFKLKSIDPLPDLKPEFISAQALKDRLSTVSETCMDEKGQPVITIMDFRNEAVLNAEHPPPRIKANCRTITLLLDDLLKKSVVDSIPRSGIVITVTETGNRDTFVIKFLSKFGFDNIKGLEFGMRGWLKNRYPVD